jgi:hypothetical protein
MRSFLALGGIGIISLTVAATAQNPPPQGPPTPRGTQAPSTPGTPVTIDDYEKAHAGLFGEKRDKVAEAVRLTKEVASVVPGKGKTGPIPRRNYIDDRIFGRMERDGVPHAPLASDEEFVRRAYLDAVGLLPAADVVRQFVASNDPRKRDALVDALVGTDEFASQWAWFWGDLLGSNQSVAHAYNKQWLKVDRPYNEVFADITTAVAKEHDVMPQAGFYENPNYNATRAVSPTDPDNYMLTNRLDFVDEVTVNSSRIFLGVNIDCVSCHNGARHLENINLYLSKVTRAQFHQQAAFFGQMRKVSGWSDRVLNISTDAIFDDSAPGYTTGNDGLFYTAAESRFPRNGRTYEPAFLLTGEKPKPGENPRQALARIVPTHIQFSRAAVNLVWGRLMVVGFVEPYDGFDLARLDPGNPPPAPWSVQPTNPELLDALADDFRASNFSIQRVIKTIMKSSAYQLSTGFDGEWKESYVPYYARRYARMMTGPEVADAVSIATGRPYRFTVDGQPATHVKELSSPGAVNQGRRARAAAGGAPVQNEGPHISALMQAFFQSSRQTPSPTGNQASSVQAMLMMISPVVGDRVKAENGTRLATLLESGAADDQVLDELFLATLARRPTAGEITAARPLLVLDRKTGFEDIQWALLNSAEFLLNH